MPLVFSPLSEDLLGTPPRGLYPRHAFIMRQIGSPPDIDVRMADLIGEILKDRGIKCKDADASTGQKDFLDRILGLIRGTGLTVAIFSNETRGTAMANIALELGFAAMCGKPLIVAKSKDAKAPSDLTRTDWIDYDPDHEDKFKRKISQAVDTIDDLAAYQEMLGDLALNARLMDCAIAFERISKAFLLNANPVLIEKALKIEQRIADCGHLEIADLDRLKDEVTAFITQGRRSLGMS